MEIQQQETKSGTSFRDYLFAILLYILLNLLVFHTGFFGRYFSRPDSYAGNAYGRMQVLHHAEKQGRQPVIALVGDSTTEDAIGAKELTNSSGRKAVNLALPGTTPMEWLYFLKSIDPEKNRFSMIVLTVAPQALRTRPEEAGFQALLTVAPRKILFHYMSQTPDNRDSWVGYYSILDRIYAHRSDLRDLLLAPRNIGVRTRERAEFIRKLNAWPGEDYDVCRVELDPQSGKVVNWGDIRDRQVRELASNALNRTEKLNERPAASGVLEPFGEIQKYYSGSNTKLVFTTIPFGLFHQIRRQSRQMRLYFKGMEALAEHPNVYHWDATTEELFRDCRNYYDFRHLNARGRSLFTHRLSQILREYDAL